MRGLGLGIGLSKNRGVSVAVTATITITSVSSQGTDGDVPINYTIDIDDSTVEAVVFVSTEADPVASDFNGGSAAAYVDQGTVALTTSGSPINMTVTGTFDGLVKLALLPTGGGDSDVVVSSAFTIDTTAPTVSTLSPADGATNVAIADNLVMTFSEGMKRQGTVTLKNVGGATIETFDLSTDGTWSTVSETDDRITLNPASDFINSASLAVQWSGLEDTKGNALDDNATDTTWNFDVVAAAGVAFSDAITDPANNSGSMRYTLTTASVSGATWMDGGAQVQSIDTMFDSGMAAGEKTALLSNGASFVVVWDVQQNTDTQFGVRCRSFSGTTTYNDVATFHLVNGNWNTTPPAFFDHYGFTDVSSLYGEAAGTVWRIWVAWTKDDETRVLVDAPYTTSLGDGYFRNFAIFDRTTFDASNATMDTEIAGMAI